MQMADEQVEEVVQRLRRAFALVEGFSFYVVVCSRIQARSVIAGASQNSTWRHEQLTWPAQPGDTAEISRERRRMMLERLHMRRASGDTRIAVWLDATDDADDANWRELFRRMNEQRNAIMRAVDAPMILLTTQRLCNAFAAEAPDCWSIRSFSEDIDEDG
jgi:hypothetical protein